MSQLERLVWIDGEIHASGGVAVSSIAGRFEVSSRQAKRDIEYLKYRLEAPIEYDRKSHKYVYKHPFESLEFADERALLDLAFLRSIAEESSYLPFLSDNLNKCLIEGAGSYAEIARNVRYELPDRERPAGKVARALCRSMQRGTFAEFSYIDSKGKESRRKTQPLRLINYGGKWYCLGRDSAAGEIRTFALSRIENPSSTDAKAPPPPPDEAIERVLSSSYGIFKGEPLGEAVLRFSGGAARAVRNQTWHKDQRISVIHGEPEPEIDLILPVHDWTELLGRALRCGSSCGVLAPPEFRARWMEEIRAMAALTEIREVSATGTTGVPSVGL
jgi:predicted DNA-binding transcriptional regulator YafY